MTYSSVRFRAASMGDAAAVAALVNERELIDRGICETSVAAVRAQWTAPEIVLAADAVVGELDGRLVCGALATRDREYAYVAPDHEGHGLGSRLLDWVMARSVARGAVRHMQIVGSGNAAAAALLQGAGYERARSWRRMGMALDDEAAAVGTCASGAASSELRIRAIDADRDAHELHRLDAHAFADNPDYEPEPFEEFCDEHLRADDFDPAASLAVIDGERIVGYLLGARRRRGVGHVSVLGVDPTMRRRGVASLLLYRAFAIWRADGIGRAELNVASDNPGAERLYRRLGMEVVFTQDCYERPRSKVRERVRT